MSKLDHIKFVPWIGGQVCCYHCGGSYQVFPATAGMAAVVLKQFGKEHKKCKQNQRGKDLLATNIGLYEKMDPKKRNVFGVITPPPNQTLGEKIVHALTMEEMARQDLGDFKIVTTKNV